MSSPLSLQEIEERDNENGGFAPPLGGCFGQGPGYISENTETGARLLERGRLTINTANFMLNESYDIEVTGIKGPRQATNVLRVEVVTGEPPTMWIG